MTALEPTVTVTGADRARLITDLTVRFGRIDVVGERQVTLPDGSEGWELTVRHRPFVTDAPAPVVEAADVSGPEAEIAAAHAEASAASAALGAARAELETLRAQVVEAQERAKSSGEELDAVRREAEALRAEASAAHDRAEAAQDEARAAHAQAEKLGAELQKFRAESERRTKALRDEAAQTRKIVDAEVREDAAELVASARQQAQDMRAQAEAELAAGRIEAREHIRDARSQAQALLHAARTEAERAVVEGKQLGEGLRAIMDRYRELGKVIDAELQQAQKTIAERTSLSSVQAHSRAEQPDLQASAAAVAAEVVRALGGDK